MVVVVDICTECSQNKTEASSFPEDFPPLHPHPSQIYEGEQLGYVQNANTCYFIIGLCHSIASLVLSYSNTRTRMQTGMCMHRICILGDLMCFLYLHWKAGVSHVITVKMLLYQQKQRYPLLLRTQPSFTILHLLSPEEE